MSKDKDPIVSGAASPYQQHMWERAKDAEHQAAVARQDADALGKALTAVQVRCNELLEETRAQRAELVTLRQWKEDASRRFVDAVMSASAALEAAYDHALTCEKRAARWKMAAHSFRLAWRLDIQDKLHFWRRNGKPHESSQAW